MNIEDPRMVKQETKSSRMPVRPPPIHGASRRQRCITDIPEESSTSEEITKNTTVTTSVRREVTETRILSPSKRPVVTSGDAIDGASELSTLETASRLAKTGKMLMPENNTFLILPVVSYVSMTRQTSFRLEKMLILVLHMRRQCVCQVSI